MSEYEINITVSPLLSEALLSLSKALESIPNGLKPFVNLSHPFIKFGSVDINLAVTARAVDGGVCFEPSDSFLNFVSALRAGEFDSFIVKVGSHRESLS